MPRKPRLYQAGVPCHVIQCGNNRTDCFFTDQDRLVYLEWLEDAYELMTNHVHLLLTPSMADFGSGLPLGAIDCRMRQCPL